MSTRRFESRRAELEAEQHRRLLALMAELREGNDFYRARLHRAPLQGGGLGELLDAIDLLTKHELVQDQLQNPPYGTNLTYDIERYVRLHQTSGTSGSPLVWLDTADSWQWFLDGWADIFRAIGVNPRDRVFFAFSFGPFIGFWAAFESCRQLDVLALSGGALTTDQRLDAILGHSATVLVCTPTYALRLAEAASLRNIDLRSSTIRLTLHAGEPGASLPAVKDRLEREWGAVCHDHAGATEVGPWGIPGADGFMEINEQEFIAELIDPATEEKLSAQEGGTPGELVLTNLGRHGSPVLRYRTGDLVEMWPARQAGFVRLRGGVLSRVDDMVVVRGVNIYPSAIEALVREFEAESRQTIDEYRVDVTRRDQMAELEMKIECSASDPARLREALAAKLRSQLSLRVPIEVVPANSLPRFELKAKRFHVQRA